MPRRSAPRRHEGPKVYAKPDGAVLWVRFVVAGRKVRRSTGAADPQEAERRAHEIWLEEHALAGQVAPGLNGAEPPLDEVVAQYLAWRTLHQRGSESYLRTLEDNLTHHVVAHFDHLSELTPEAWERTHAVLRAKVRRGQPMSWSTICRQTSAAQGLLKWAVKHGAPGAPAAVPVLPWPERKAVVRGQKRRRALTVEERDQVLAEMQGEARRWYVVAFYTALRSGEMAALCLRWIDFRQRTISIPAGDQKSADVRDEAALDLPPPAAAAIREQLRERGIIDPGAPIFGPVEHVKAFWGAVERAGIDTAGLTARHVTKHTRLTQLGAAGGQTALLAVMAQGRHKDPKTSMRYVKPGLVHARAAAELADAPPAPKKKAKKAKK